MQEHLHILKRVGKVLVIAGLIDTAIMVYCIANHKSYSSTINIFAVIAGIFLLRGSPKAAGIVTWLCIFALISSLMEPLIELFQPFDLLRQKITVYSQQVLINAVLWAIPTLLFLWVVKELLRNPVLWARAEKRVKNLYSRVSHNVFVTG